MKNIKKIEIKTIVKSGKKGPEIRVIGNKIKNITRVLIIIFSFLENKKLFLLMNKFFKTVI